MSIAIISDIHANKEAFDTFLTAIHRNKSVQKIMNLGDTVGYCADPEYCIDTCLEMERKGTMINILGNHEAVLLDEYSKLLSEFNPNAREATKWTKDRLNPEQIAAIKKWPIQIVRGNIAYAHGRPKRTGKNQNQFEKQGILSAYTTFKPLRGIWSPKGEIIDKSRIHHAFAEMSITNFDIWFVGHYHRQEGYMLKKGKDPNQCHEISFDLEDTIELRKDYRYILAPGSLGQPRIRRNGDDLKSCYLIFNEKEKLVTFLRKEFDKELTAKKMRNQPCIPSHYADFTDGTI